ncbi:hypothetical protein R1flu_000260 [Riccia fluitans]|uniref:Uncharacterized protein n=1 Tax=Riccia fluitans TaxID=41844 RepID=A0ABD1XZY0_9MARC
MGKLDESESSTPRTGRDLQNLAADQEKRVFWSKKYNRINSRKFWNLRWKTDDEVSAVGYTYASSIVVTAALFCAAVAGFTTLENPNSAHRRPQQI